MRVFKFDVAGEETASLRDRLIHKLQSIRLVDGVVGVHLCATKVDASAVRSVEKKDQVLARPSAWTVLIEFGAELQDVGVDHPMSADVLGQEPGIAGLQSNVFHLQYQVLGVELTSPRTEPPLDRRS